MNTEVNLCGIKMKNPVTVASGTFGYGREYSEFYDLGEIGAICTKGTSLRPKTGNKAPRVCETSSGMLNAIGLENKGLEYFAEFDLPFNKNHVFEDVNILNIIILLIIYLYLCAKILN